MHPYNRLIFLSFIRHKFQEVLLQACDTDQLPIAIPNHPHHLSAAPGDLFICYTMNLNSDYPEPKRRRSSGMNSTSSQAVIPPQMSPGIPFSLPKPCTSGAAVLLAGDVGIAEEPGNDCELLVYGREQVNYAEMVEKRLLKMGFKVDLILIPPETKTSTILTRLTAMRTMFGVAIHPQNELLRSLTIHVIETPPGAAVHRQHQCHKNMGLEDAYLWLKKQAALYKLEEFKVIPTSAKRQMKDLAAGEYMTDLEYQSLIDYMHDRWIAQRTLQGKTSFEDGTGISTQEELRARIMNVLGVIDAVQAPDEIPDQPSLSGGRRNDNPQVQDAVDTLMRSALNPFGLQR